jgi:hypothetical protein
MVLIIWEAQFSPIHSWWEHKMLPLWYVTKINLDKCLAEDLMRLNWIYKNEELNVKLHFFAEELKLTFFALKSVNFLFSSCILCLTKRFPHFTFTMYFFFVKTYWTFFILCLVLPESILRDTQFFIVIAKITKPPLRKQLVLIHLLCSKVSEHMSRLHWLNRSSYTTVRILCNVRALHNSSTGIKYHTPQANTGQLTITHDLPPLWYESGIPSTCAILACNTNSASSLYADIFWLVMGCLRKQITFTLE